MPVTKERYLKIVTDAERGLKGLENKYGTAAKYYEETNKLVENIKEKIMRFRTHLLEIDKKLNRQAHNSSVGRVERTAKKAEPYSTNQNDKELRKKLKTEKAKVEAVIETIEKKIFEFEEKTKKANFYIPNAAFEKYSNELETLKKELLTREAIDEDFEKKCIVPKTEEISKYSNLCINFVNFYNENHEALKSMCDFLDKANGELEKNKTTTLGVITNIFNTFVRLFATGFVSEVVIRFISFLIGFVF